MRALNGNVIIGQRQIFYLCFFATLLVSGCRKEGSDGSRLTPAVVLWDKVEREYITNDASIAYPLVLKARDDLMNLERSGDDGLDYPYCFAVMNGRLFIMARSLGKTNEAESFLKKSSSYWNIVRTQRRLPVTNYTGEDIEALIKRRDGH